MNTATEQPAECSRERQLVELWARHGALGARRSAHDAMALGAQLLLIKSATPRGEFKDRVNSLGLSASSAQHYMAVARRFFHLPNSFIESVGTATNLILLLALEDEAVNALSRGEEINGLSSDALSYANLKYLRQAVREQVADEPPTRTRPSVTLSVEEERILRLFRKCDPAARDALVRVARVMHRP